MKVLYILFLAATALMLNSCASVFAGGRQEVAIKSATPVKLTIDSNYIGQGREFKPILERDASSKQFIFKSEGYKTEYKIVLQNRKSNWYYMSIIPFGILLYPPLYDMAANTWTYLDSYSYPALRMYENSDPSNKNLIMNNISFEVNKNNFKVDLYDYSDYIDGDKPRTSKSMDSIGIRSSIYSDDLEEILKKTNYTDTINTVFMDNVNTLTLNAKITNLVYNEVHRTYGLNLKRSKFMDAELTTFWTLQNVYGDTVHSESIKTSSGQFSLDFYKVEEADKMSIKDALENSLWDYIGKLKKSNLLNTEKNKIEFPNSIKIAKSTKAPTSISEAMAASVTIKNKEGHGSGFVISNDGYIITNHHVVSKNGEYTVVTGDGTEYKAKVIRSNKAIDLALIKVEGKFDIAFEVPDKQNYKIGDEILAIGTPKSVQLGQSVSKGIVSGARKNKGMNYLQTDIKINKGNSGGPIVLSNGQLTSVVEYKLIGQGVEGLSFSIPAYDIFPNLNLSY